MIILYGLGNNEEKYLNTKHNIGRKVLEIIAQKNGLNFSLKNKVYEVSFKKNGENVKLIYSSDFMNTSGVNLREYLRYQNLERDTRIMVLQDDSDQKEGNLKLVNKGGSAGHRGIDSINRENFILKDTYLRLKIGIRPEMNRLKSETFVLSKMTQLDEKTVQETVKIILDSEFLNFLNSGQIDKATTLVNSTKILPQS